MVATYIVYVPRDAAAAQLVHRRYPEYILYEITRETLPTIPELEVNNVIHLGGPLANPYAKLEFPDMKYDFDKMWDYPEVYAGGKRLIKIRVRPNNTTVAFAFGKTAIDTMEATYDFLERWSWRLAPWWERALITVAGSTPLLAVGGVVAAQEIQKSR